MKRRTIGRILLWVGAAIVGLPLLSLLILIGLLAILDQSNGSIVTSGQQREYLLHVPESYDPTEPTALVVSLHSGATWPAHQKNLSRWNRLADEHGFIVVYPAGNPLPGVPGRSLIAAKMWHSFEVGAGLEREVRFVGDLIDQLQSQYNVDAMRIYVNGFSNGGGMSFVLACAMADRIAAVGLVAAAEMWAFFQDHPLPE